MKAKHNQLKRRLAPGLWEDAAGSLHWSIPELLEWAELEDTPDNRARLSATLHEVILASKPGILIIEREKPEG